MSAKWVKFTGSEEQISEIDRAKFGWIARSKEGVESGWILDTLNAKHTFCIAGSIQGSDRGLFKYHPIYEYLICKPHPHADMIIEWARTGREVYEFNEYPGVESYAAWVKQERPLWLPNCKYSFNPDNESSSSCHGDGK